MVIEATGTMSSIVHTGIALVLFALVPTLGLADGHDDHERARRALAAGEVLPLHTVLRQVERDYPGQLIEVKLERDEGLWFYEIKLIGGGGAMRELKLDARTGTINRVRGRETRRDRNGEDH